MHVRMQVRPPLHGIGTREREARESAGPWLNGAARRGGKLGSPNVPRERIAIQSPGVRPPEVKLRRLECFVLFTLSLTNLLGLWRPETET